MARVSYSQYGMYSTCQEQYKLNYIDKLGTSSANIHTIFGSAMHETIQHFLDVMYNVTKKQALQLDLETMLYNQMVEHFKKESEKMDEGMYPCKKEELGEFFQDGKLILSYFTKKLDKLYTKSGFELVAIEQVLNAKIKEGVNFVGFIDVLLKDKTTQEYVIIDLKTSTRGWNKYQKANKIKTSQMLLYKKFYSEKYDIPLDKIKVEYQILKRKINENYEFPIPRISKFVPANGKPSINKVVTRLDNFITECFNSDGEYNTEHIYRKEASKKNCKFCEFNQTEYCDAGVK